MNRRGAEGEQKESFINGGELLYLGLKFDYMIEIINKLSVRVLENLSIFYFTQFLI
jgi:hypothetical protein